LRSSVLTRPTLLGSTTPRLYTPPLVVGRPGPCGCGCALTPSTSLGFSAVDFARDPLGIEPLPWQRWLLIHSLELKPGGGFRFRTIVILVARQNGKTAFLEIKNLWKMFVRQVPLIISTAQDLDVAEESWDKAIEIVESIPELDAEKKNVDKTNGKKTLHLTNGSRWKPKAAGRRPGRGLSGDDVNLDELREHLNWQAWAAVTKTTMARPNAQIWGFSNAGDDRSIVLNDLQLQGRAAVANPDRADPSLGYFEWSAPDDVKCTCKTKPHLDNCRLQDRKAWAQANPSYGYTITDQALAAALSTDPEAVYRTECLCQRVQNLAEWGIFNSSDWHMAQDPASTLTGRPAYCVEVSRDLSTMSIGAAGIRDDGLRHLELVDRFPADEGKLIGQLKKRIKQFNPVAIVIDPAGPANYLIPKIEKHCGVTVVQPIGREVAAACASVYTGISALTIASRDVRIRPHPSLDAAAKVADWKDRGDAKVFDRKTEELPEGAEDEGPDVSPLMAVALADHGFSNAPRTTEIWAAYG
jgi:hypothetical protein